MLRVLSSQGKEICQDVTSYLLNRRHHFYEDLSEAIRRIVSFMYLIRAPIAQLWKCSH